MSTLDQFQLDSKAPSMTQTRCVRSSLFVLAVMIAIHSAEAGDAERTRFLQEAPQRWKEYRLVCSGFKVVYGGEESEDLTAGTIKKTGISTYARKKSCMLITYADSPTDDITAMTRAIGRNRNYAFQLVRTSGKSKWQIEQLLFRDAQQKPQDLLSLCDRVDRSIDKGLNVHGGGDTLDDLVTQPRFKLKDVEMTTLGGESLAVVHYELLPTPTQGGESLTDIGEGLIRLLPNKYWLVHSSEFTFRTGSGEHAGIGSVVTTDFQELRIGVPVVTRMVIESRYQTPEGKESGSRTTSLETYEIDDSPSEEAFTLTAFGLPEPVRPGIRWWWLLVLLGGALLISLPAIFRKRTKA